MLPDQFGDAIIDIGPNRVRGHGAQFVLRYFHCQIHLTLMPHVDDRRHQTSAHQELRHGFDRPLRRREPDALRFRERQRFQSLQRQGQVSTAFIRHNGVDFIDDDGPDGL